MAFLNATMRLFRAHGAAVWFAALLFFAGAAQGYLVTAARLPPRPPSPQAQEVPDARRSALRERLDGTLADRVLRHGPIARIARLRGIALAAAIWLKNALAVTLAVVLGRLTLGAFPFLVLVLNGRLLGEVLAASVAAGGAAGPAFAMVAILPHGIIELPTVWLGTGYGLWQGGRAWRRMASLALPVDADEPPPPSRLPRFAPSRVLRLYRWLVADRQPRETRRMLAVLAAWLAVAAGVEAFVTPALLGRGG